MKKIRKTVKKMSKKIISLIMLIAMIFSYIAPVTNALAATINGEGSKFITADLTNNLGFTIVSKTINEKSWADKEDEFHTNDDKYQVVINVSSSTNTGDKVPDIQYSGDWKNYITKSSFLEDNVYKFILDIDLSKAGSEERSTLNFLGLSINEKEENYQPQPNSGENGEGQTEGHGNEPHFDGKAYVVWSCESGTCYHYFDNIPAFDDGNSTFYKDTDVIANNDSDITFDVHAKYKDWILKEDFERWVTAYKNKYNITGEIDWTKVKPDSIIGEPRDMRKWEEEAIKSGKCTRPAEDSSGDERENFERCVDTYVEENDPDYLPFVKLQPVGEPTDNNAYVSYGDRNFKVVIYNSKFKGVTLGDLSGLHYYPARWTNPFLRTDQYDISDTTKEKPALMDSILLESTVRIKSLGYNSFKIVSIEALDVPKDAVTITKKNDEFELVFSSNFYDKVVFKITDDNNKESYILIKRYTIDGWIKFTDNHPVLTADFYFDRERTYKDFNLTARIVYKNGEEKTVTLTPHLGVDDGLGNYSEEYEVDQESTKFGPSGKGLKLSNFEFLLEDGEDRNISKVYLNAEYKGSTASNYAGAYVGSGKGTLANIYQEEESE